MPVKRRGQGRPVLAGHPLRVCKVCGFSVYSEASMSAHFFKQRLGKYGHSGTCKKCSLEKNRNPQNVLSKRKSKIKTRYGITIEEYTKRLGDNCEICGSSEKLCYDHCHITHLFRGTLCHKCNGGIGLLGDNYEGLLKASEYLKKYEISLDKGEKA